MRHTTSPPTVPRSPARHLPVAGRILLGAAVLGCGLLAVGAPGCGGTRDHRPRGVLLVSLDTLAAHHLKSYGYERDTAPGLDRWMARGARFEHCMAASDWTLPSHMSMLTGVRPRRHGVVDHTALGGPAVPLVSEILQRRGIATAAFTQHTNVSKLFGFDRGFDRFFQVEQSARFQDPQAVLQPAGAWLREHRAGPFFAFVHVFGIHWPHLQPEPYRSRFDPDYQGSVQGVQADVNRLTAERLSEQDRLDFEHLRALYDGNIGWVDEQVSRFLDELDAAIGLDDVLVILTSDHGEAFKEHGYYGHGISFQREEIDVPLALVWPSRIAAGRIVSSTACGTDLARTVLGALGLDPGLIEGDGLNLLESLAGDLTRRPLVSESSLGMNQLHFDRLALVNDGYKYIAFPSITRFEARFGEALFNLREDPLEQHNLIDEEAEIAERFRHLVQGSLEYTVRDAFLVMVGPSRTGATLEARVEGGPATYEMVRFTSRVDPGAGRAPEWLLPEALAGEPEAIRLSASPGEKTNAVFIVPGQGGGRLRVTVPKGSPLRPGLYAGGGAPPGERPLPAAGIGLTDLEPIVLDRLPALPPDTVAVARTRVLAYPDGTRASLEHLPEKARRQLEASGYLGGTGGSLRGEAPKPHRSSDGTPANDKKDPEKGSETSGG